MANQIQTAIRNEVERETRKSRYRDRFSRQRLHPITADIGALVSFVIDRRRRQAGALELARCALGVIDTEVIRLLVEIVRRGSCNRAMLRRCRRLEHYCEIIEAALALKGK